MHGRYNLRGHLKVGYLRECGGGSRLGALQRIRAMYFVEQNTFAFSCDVEIVEGVDEAGVETDGVGPCIGVAIINHSRGWTGVLHADNLDNKDELLRDFLAGAKANTGGGDELEIWIGGGDATDPDIRQQVLAARANAWSLLTQSFPGAPQPVWNDAGNYMLEIAAPSDPTELIVTEVSY